MPRASDEKVCDAQPLAPPSLQWRRSRAGFRCQGHPALSDVVRVTYVLPDGSEFPRCWPVLKKYFGAVRPAATMISAGLADPRMKIEIEVTALKQAR
jgi:enamine deaminase RidA (YjgF/YER057c/UK114 family)